MESDNTDTAEQQPDKLAKLFRQQRNDILEVLIKLVITRRKEALHEEAEDAFNAACRTIRDWGPIVAQEFEEEKAAQGEAKPGDMTLAELVKVVQGNGAGSVMVAGSSEDDLDARAWLVIAAVGDTANALYRWNQIDYEDDFVDQYAQAAYEAYGAFTDNKNFQGNPMPSWSELPGRIRGAWNAAAFEIAQLCVGNDASKDNEEPEPDEADPAAMG